nr:unnamed protein product [Digitaria exilis]
MEKCPPLPLDALQKLSTTVKVLDISEMNMLSGKELTQMLSFMWKLSELQIQRCEKIRALGVLEQQEEEIAPPDELLLLPPQLEKLYIRHFPELSEDTAEMLEQGSSLPPSFNLESLRTDDIAAVLAAPICALLFSSLTTLTFDDNKEIECFTKEQGEAIELLTSD